MSEYSLRLYSRTGSGSTWRTTFADDLTAKAKDWRRSIKLQGGPWQGTFKISGPAKELLTWFYERLGWHVEERSGGQTTWEGMVYEVDLALDGITRRRSLNTMTNAVLPRTGYHPETVWEKDWARYKLNPASIARYGRKEELVTYTGGQTAATTHCARWASAPMQPQSFAWSNERKVSGEGELTVTVCGYAFTMNWLFSAAYWWNVVDEMPVSEALTYLLQHGHPTRRGGSDTPFIASYLIRPNTSISYPSRLTSYSRVWDLVQEIVSLGDSNANPWRAYVAPGRKFIYEAVPSKPVFYLREDGLFTAVGSHAELNPYQAQPGVVRDVHYPYRTHLPESWFEEQRDLLVEEIEVSGGKLHLRSGNESGEEIIAAQTQMRENWAAFVKAWWDKANDDDFEKRRKDWESQNPGVPFTGQK